MGKKKNMSLKVFKIKLIYEQNVINRNKQLS